MKILTFNTWQERGSWRDRWEVIFRGIERLRPDVIALQEVFNASWAREIQKRTALPHLVFPPVPSGLLCLSLHAVTAVECRTLSTKSPTEDYLRYVLFMECQTSGGGLAVFNTHLSWKLEEGEIREKQVGELLDFVEARSGASETVVMGDFNAPPETAEIRQMIVRGKFVDTFRACHPKDAGLTWDNRNPYAAGSSIPMPDRRIDYLFARNAGRVLGRLKSCDLVLTEPDDRGIYASDHYGLLGIFGGHP